MSSNSPFPVLTDVLFYTPTDGYNYLTDNRPLYQLDSNIRAVAASLIGLGYGEHLSVSGDILSAGRGVELLANGTIKYPDATTSSHAGTAILGITIGYSGAGLTKVIWGSSLLDLSILGLEGILSGAVAGQYIEILANSTGNIRFVTEATASSLLVGMVKSSTCISVGKEGQTTVVTDSTPQKNHYNNFGIIRKRNFELLSMIDSMPIQFNKETKYQSDFLTDNPLAIQYTASTGVVSAATTGGVRPSDSSIIREFYTQFLTEEYPGINSGEENVEVAGTRSLWSERAFPTTLEGSAPNYELEPSTTSGVDYTTSSNLSLYKKFYITKYYQYFRASSVNDPEYGKVSSIVTVLESKLTNSGGEPGRVIICDFFTYNIAGLEIKKQRVVLLGAAAETLYANTAIFPTELKS